MAFPTIRDRILDAMVTRFQAIDGEAPYQLAVKKVSRDPAHVSDQSDRSQFPVIWLVATREGLQHKFFQKTENELKVHIDCHLHPGESESPAKKLEMLIHDIKVAFYVDLTWGGLAISSLLGPEIRIPYGAAMKSLTHAEIDSVLLYRNPRGEP